MSRPCRGGHRSTRRPALAERQQNQTSDPRGRSALNYSVE
jgi:hypothetical protein